MEGRSRADKGPLILATNMKITHRTISSILTGVAALILLAAIPSAVQDTLDTGRVYLFSSQFLEELPQRLTGPGRLRFLLQPLVAMVLGWRAGLSDARVARPPYVYGLLMGGVNRAALLRSGLAAIRDLVAIGVILDAVSQILIYGQLHPGAALVVGPVLISVPYVVARALTNRVSRLAHRRG